MLVVCGSVGLLVCWSVGLLVCGSVGDHLGEIWERVVCVCAVCLGRGVVGCVGVCSVCVGVCAWCLLVCFCVVGGVVAILCSLGRVGVASPSSSVGRAQDS